MTLTLTLRRRLGKIRAWLLVGPAWLCLLAAGHGAGEGDWPVYGADAASTKYSPLDRIRPDNVADLRVAWSWQSIDVPTVEAGQAVKLLSTNLGSFQSTPLYVEGVLYTSTSLSQVAAIDPATGETIWSYDPKSYETGRPPNWGFVHRGIAFWSRDDKRRIFYGTGDGRLISLDAKTGRPDAQFGDGGAVDLKKGVPRLAGTGQLGVTSPPVICRNLVIVGSSISDVARVKEMPPGRIKAFDPDSGDLRWSFDLIPTVGQFGNDTWEEGSWTYTGSANAWAPMSADEDLGFVYVPVSTPTNDWYGGHRLGNNLFAESLVCLEAETGRRVWHFQIAHHGLWDYDLAAAPVLADITVDGKAIKAVAQVTKQGFCFVFDRVTGEPVWPIEERPVPGSDVPGEKASPTQPIPTRPPAFERQGISEDDLIDFTPALRAEALEIIKPHRIGPLYTPASVQGTLQLPGSSGGANWGGAAFDPDTGRLFIPSITSPIIVHVGEPDASRSNLRYAVTQRRNIKGPQDLPLLKPPYGRITAIDLNRGEIAWQVARGDGPRDHPLLKDLNLPPLGQVGRAGPLLTKTLLFVAEGTVATNSAGRDGGGNEFYAYDKASGAVIWKTELPAPATGTPMTYLHEGKQYIVMAVADRESPPTLVALSLP